MTDEVQWPAHRQGAIARQFALAQARRCAPRAGRIACQPPARRHRARIPMYYLALSIAIVSAACYHLSMKMLPGTVNPFLPLVAAYAMALVLCLIGLALWPEGSRSLSALRPSVFGVALGVVGIEIGFLLAYRAGWNVGYAALVANVCSTIILLPVGLIYFREQITPQKFAGVVLSLAGLALLIKK